MAFIFYFFKYILELNVSVIQSIKTMLSTQNRISNEIRTIFTNGEQSGKLPPGGNLEVVNFFNVTYIQ